VRIILSTVTAAALATSSLVAAAQAAPIANQAAVSQPAINLNDVQKTQFFFGGQNYCWYDGGWQGPGFYWCGYAWRHGMGWGGGRGWHGWHGGGHIGHMGHMGHPHH
jgi:hypothetical protein